jgi:hypothetical protein
MLSQSAKRQQCVGIGKRQAPAVEADRTLEARVLERGSALCAGPCT